MNDLLNDKLTEPTEVSFTEPDLEFILYPKIDIRKNPKTLYVREGLEIADISADLILNLEDIDKVYSGEKYIYPMDREEITKLKDCLEAIISTLQKQFDKIIRG